MTSRFAVDGPVGLVLSGGGARGAFQVGVWDVLSQQLDGIPAVISGTSAGALNGAFIASGMRPDQMLEFWLDLAKTPPIAANERLFRSLADNLARILVREPLRPLRRRVRGAKIGLQFAWQHNLALLRPSGMLALGLELLMTSRYDNLSTLLDRIDTAHAFTTTRLRERLVRVFGGERVPARTALAINTIDIETGRVLRFVNRAPKKRASADHTHYRVHQAITVDMVLASASIPLLFNPVQVDGHQLWDGGVLVNTPLAPTIALGARRIIPVLVNPGIAADRDDSTTRLGSAIERLADAFLENAYNADRKLLLIRNELARAKHSTEEIAIADLYRPIRPTSSRTFNAGSYLYFERDALLRMYQAGQTAARGWLASGPPLDSPALPE